MKKFLYIALLLASMASGLQAQAEERRTAGKMPPSVVKVDKGAEIPDYEPVKPSPPKKYIPYAGANAKKSAPETDGGIGGSFIFLVVAAMAYFFPYVVAKSRLHRNSLPIFWLNLLAGWTGVGWLASFIWSLTADTKRRI